MCNISLFLVLISGLGLGDAIFYSKPLKVMNIEIPKSLIYILICHLVLVLICWIVYTRLSIGRWTLTNSIWIASFVMSLVTSTSDADSKLRVFSFILLYARWTILQLQLPNLVPTNVRGSIFCLGRYIFFHTYIYPWLVGKLSWKIPAICKINQKKLLQKKNAHPWVN